MRLDQCSMTTPCQMCKKAPRRKAGAKHCAQCYADTQPARDARTSRYEQWKKDHPKG